MTVYRKLDAKDIEMISNVRAAGQIRLTELARKVNMNTVTVRSRIINLALAGLVRIEQGHNTFIIFPVEAAAEV